MKSLAPFIEHTALAPDLSAEGIRHLCQEALTHNFFAVCVATSRLIEATHHLEDSDVKIVGVVGFPFGNEDSDIKRFSTEAAIDLGAQEIDMVMNIGRLKDGDRRYIKREIRDVVESAEEHPVKIILEVGLLTPEEIQVACELVQEGEAHFVKTSTGYGPRATTVEDIHLLRKIVGPNFGIKASGGIRTPNQAHDLINAGASRIGTSRGPDLVA